MSYPDPILEKRINGLDLKIVGVHHNRTFFQKYEGFFQEQINGGQAIFIEDGPQVLTHEFFGEIAKVAQDANKPIYIIEPSNNFHGVFEAVQFVAAANLAASYLRGPRKPMSRRNFLTKGFLSLLGLGLMGGITPLRGWIQDAVGDEHVTIDDLLTYGTLADYRNIVAAENLDRISRKIHLEGQIPYFIGDGHVKGISAYLGNPELRRKRLIYSPQDWVSDTSVRKYEFREGVWELTERI